MLNRFDTEQKSCTLLQTAVMKTLKIAVFFLTLLFLSSRESYLTVKQPLPLCGFAHSKRDSFLDAIKEAAVGYLPFEYLL